MHNSEYYDVPSAFSGPRCSPWSCVPHNEEPERNHSLREQASKRNEIQFTANVIPVSDSKVYRNLPLNHMDYLQMDTMRHRTDRVPDRGDVVNSEPAVCGIRYTETVQSWYLCDYVEEH